MKTASPSRGPERAKPEREALREKRGDEALDAIETARKEIGQELHDGLCQHLKGLEFKLAALVLETRADPKTNEKLRNVYDATRDILRRAQNLSAAMLPDGLAKEDLMRRIQCDMENIAHERGAKLLLLADFDYEAPSDDDAAQIFRIVQESVLNAAIHGKAAKIVVEFMKRKGRPSLRIRDDGSGFDARPASARTSLGLGIMRARAKTIGARIQIVSAKGEGTTVVCSPLPEKRNPRKD